MKKLNKRLSQMSTLAELLTLRGTDLEKGTWGWPGQDYWNPAEKNPNQALERNRQRAKSWPKFSIHGHNTQINLKVHCSQEIVGELRLLDPRGDQSPDHFLMLPASEDDAELFEDDPRWPQAIQECPHAQLENPLRFWAALDIIFMMAISGFKIRTWGYNERCIFANGTLLPDSTDQYGRFAFHMDVAGNHRWIPKDAKGEKFITPAFDVEGIDTTFPPKADEELVLGTPVKKYTELEIPSGKDVGIAAMDPGANIGYFLMLDENGNPAPRDKSMYYEKVVGKMGVGGNGITYSLDALKNLDIHHIEAQARELTAKFMGLPPALVIAGPPMFSVRAHTTLNERLGIATPVVLSDRHLNSDKELSSVAELMAAAEAAIAKQPVPMLMAGDFADGSGVKIMLGNREISQAELEQLATEAPEDDTDDGDDTPIDYAVLNNPDNFVAQPAQWPGRGMSRFPLPPHPSDELHFGSFRADPEVLSRIDVVKDGQPVPDAQVQPTRQPTSLGGAAALGGVDKPTLTHPLGFTKEMVGLHPEGYDAKLFGLFPETDHDVPTTDLDLEADPTNWDGFCEPGVAAARRSEDGDEEQ